MALAGHDTPIAVFSDTTTTTGYSGSLTVADGELIVVCFDGIGNGSDTVSGWTVTLGGNALTYQSGPNPTAVVGIAAIFTGIASGSGAQTLSLTTGVATRGMDAHAYRITGFDTTNPIAAAGQLANYNSDVLALTSPDAITTGAGGNAVIGCIGINSGTITALAVSGADGSLTGQTGTNQFSDVEWGTAYKLMLTAGSVSFAWTWATYASKPAAAWVEINASAGGTSATANAGVGSVSAQGMSSSASSGVSSVAGSGSVSVQGFPVTASAGSDASASSGIGLVSVQGLPATASAGVAVAAGAGAVSVLGGAVSAYIPAANDLTWSGFQLTWSGDQITWTAGVSAVATTGAGSVSVQGRTTSASAAVAAVAGTGSISAQGHAVTVAVGGSVSAFPGIGTVDVSGNPATASASAIATTGAGVISVQGKASIANVGGAASASSGLGILTVQGFGATVSVGVTISTSHGTVQVSGNSATGSASVSAATGAGAITIQGRSAIASVGAVAFRRIATADESRTGVILMNTPHGVAIRKTANGA
ncbi:hypothetical protein [Hoeflea sp.]|uniref:hypothetical protein n=1 Tax=Hoeflea sp. TaxID=1940281 RepID=UPI0019B7959E|nr:hypothetical protein [Hoeflea sp.]MBC7282581.1 hypothetical protein [Hoeflea sp.]